MPEAAAFGCTAEQRPGGTQSTKAWSVLTSVLEIASGRALQRPWPVCPSPALNAAFLREFLTADDVSYRVSSRAALPSWADHRHIHSALDRSGSSWAPCLL